MAEDRFASEKNIPILPPGAAHSSNREEWYCYGTLRDLDGNRRELAEPSDPSAAYAAVADEPERLAAVYSGRARAFEISATATLFAGVITNSALVYLLITFVRAAP